MGYALIYIPLGQRLLRLEECLSHEDAVAWGSLLDDGSYRMGDICITIRDTNKNLVEVSVGLRDKYKGVKWQTCWKYVSTSEIQMGCSHSVKKRMRSYELRPCDEGYRVNQSRVFHVKCQNYSSCVNEANPDKLVVAFEKNGKCARCIMGILIDPSEAPASGEVEGWCYRYYTRDQVMAQRAKNSQNRRIHRSRSHQTLPKPKKAKKAEKA